MKNNVQYCIFDIDGTISENGLPVSNNIRQQLERISRSHQIIFASARPVRDMLPMLPESLHHSAILIGCNGGMAYQNGMSLFANVLSDNDVSKILSFLNIHQIPYVLDGKWGYSLSAISHPFHNYIDTLSNARVLENDLIDDGITKILVLSNYQKDIFLSEINSDLSIHQHKQEDIFDITPPNNNKFNTLQKLIGNKPYIAFGNDQNDFLMLDHAKVSVFLGERQDYTNADFYLKTKEIANFLATHF